MWHHRAIRAKWFFAHRSGFRAMYRVTTHWLPWLCHLLSCKMEPLSFQNDKRKWKNDGFRSRRLFAQEIRACESGKNDAQATQRYRGYSGLDKRCKEKRTHRFGYQTNEKWVHKKVSVEMNTGTLEFMEMLHRQLTKTSHFRSQWCDKKHFSITSRPKIGLF